METTPWITVTVPTGLTPQKVERSPKSNPKLGSSLNQLLEAYQRGGLAEAQTVAKMHGTKLDQDRVQVELVVAKGSVSDLREAIETIGGEYQGHYETLLQALVPLDALESLARQPGVQVIREPRRAGP
jgi:hypothetical protein